MTGRHWAMAFVFLLNLCGALFANITALRLANAVLCVVLIIMFIKTPRVRKARPIIRKDWS